MGRILLFIYFVILIYVENASAQVPPAAGSPSQMEKKDPTGSFMLNALLISLNEKVGDLKYEINALKDGKVGPNKAEIVSELSDKIDQSSSVLSASIEASKKIKCSDLMTEDKIIEDMIQTTSTKVDLLTTKTVANTVAINKCDSDVVKLTSIVVANAQAAQTYFQQILSQCGTPPVPPEQGFTSSTQVYGLSSETMVYSWKIDKDLIIPGYQEQTSKFMLSDYQMMANIGFDVSENWISLLIRFSRISATDKWSVKTLPRLYYVIKDQSGSAETKDITKTSYYTFGTTLTFDQYYYWRYETTPWVLSNSVYSKNNQISLEIHMDSPSKATKGQSYNGVCMSSITNYNKCKGWSKDRVAGVGTREGLLDWIYSPYFYSSAKGYRMQAKFDLYDYAVEEGRRWLACTVSLLTGENDAILSHSFKRKTIVTIFNQKNANKHLVASTDSSGLYVSFVFKAPDDVDSFILNDTIFYQVVVQAS